MRRASSKQITKNRTPEISHIYIYIYNVNTEKFMYFLEAKKHSSFLTDSVCVHVHYLCVCVCACVCERVYV